MTPHDSLHALLRKCCALLRPPPLLTVSQWADAERKLSSEASAEPGQWNTDRAPYQRGILDAVNDPACEEVCVMSSAQVGKTEIILNIIGYFVDNDPSPILVLQPTLEMAEAFSKDRLAPMIRDTPALRNKFAPVGARDSGNTLLHKMFPGGHVTMAGANSPASLASRPIRILLCDEVDRYPVSAGTEGDPVALGGKRTATFWNRKKVKVSTPTLKGLSRIEAEYEDSTKEKYFLDCPSCGAAQPLSWDQLDQTTCLLTCANTHCNAMHNQSEWQRQPGRWVAEKEHPFRRGFHLNELLSPWRTWRQIVTEYLEAKPYTERLKTWVNTSLGETWEDDGEQADPNSIMGRREKYGHDGIDCPAKVLILTAGVDVQRDRLEAECVGWGIGEESWSISNEVFWGNPDKAEVWDELTEWLNKAWIHENGHRLRISATCIDSGGSNTNAVYQYCKGKISARIFCIKGVGGAGRPIISAPSRRKTGKSQRPVELFTIGVDDAKSVVYSRLKLTEPGPGYCHFAHGINDDEFFKQLTAEKCVTRYHRGYAKQEWVLARSNKRNEALDKRVYALASLKLQNVPWIRLAKRMAVVLPTVQAPQAPMTLPPDVPVTLAEVPEGTAEDEDGPSAQPGFPAMIPKPPQPVPIPRTGLAKPLEDYRAAWRQPIRTQRPRVGGGWVGGWRK